MRGATQLLHRQSRARIRIRRARGELRERELAHARARIYAYGISGIVSRAQNFTMMRSSLSLSLTIFRVRLSAADIYAISALAL